MMSTKKTALVTGANKGIGLETARQLGQKGITVLVGGRDDAKARQAAEKLRKEGIDAHGVVIDVTDAASIENAAAQIGRDYGRLDVLVHNAGVLLDAPRQKPSAQSLEIWRKPFDTNLFGLIATTHALLPLL